VARVELYCDARGKEPVLDYIASVGRVRAAEAASIERYIDLLEEKGDRLGLPFARMIDGHARLHELRPGAHRVAYGRHGGAYVLLHAWRKKSQKLDQKEANTARLRLELWRERNPGRRA
jgi:phage-related protein